MIEFFFVAAGGAAGAVCRFLASLLISRFTNHSSIFTGTVTVNISGSFLMGILFGYLINNNLIPAPFLLFFSTGFLGSFTTFSTFAFEVHNLLRKPFTHLALYLTFQLAAAAAMAALGIFVGLIIAGGSIG